jgi:hypothetical protein
MMRLTLTSIKPELSRMKKPGHLTVPGWRVNAAAYL